MPEEESLQVFLENRPDRVWMTWWGRLFQAATEKFFKLTI